MDEKDEAKKVPVGDNGHWDYKAAIERKETCTPCAFGVGPFMIQGVPNMQGACPVAQIRICECTQHIYYMTLRTAIASCECWRKQAVQADKPHILIAHKKIPPLKLDRSK